jgi:hypothetical protein
MGRSPSSFAKRQRELAKKERQEQKKVKRAERKTDEPAGGPEMDTEVVREQRIIDEVEVPASEVN